MFKNPFQIAISFAFIALVIKLVIFQFGVQHGDMERYIIYIYMLLLLVTIFLGISKSKEKAENPTSFMEDLKSGARTASYFGILMGAITFIYYYAIDVNFFPLKQSERYDIYLEEVQKLIGEKSKEQLTTDLSNGIYSMRLMLSAKFQAMWTTFGLVFLGMFYALFLTIAIRKLRLTK